MVYNLRSGRYLMSQLFVLPFQVPFQFSAPLGLAKLYFYAAGTEVHQPVYTTAALSVAHDQPVRSDADGVLPPIYLNPGAASDYRIQLKTQDDVLVTGGDVDNIPRREISQADFVAYLILTDGYKRTAAEIAAGVTPTDYDFPNHDTVGFVLPGRYGWSTAASGADNYTALVAAAAVAAQATCAISFPGGTFNYTPSAKINIVSAWFGQGKVKTIINVAAAYAGEVFRVTGHAGIRDMAIYQDSAAKTAGGIGLRFADIVAADFTAYGHAQDIYVDGFEKNIDFQNVTVTTLIGVQSANGTYGVYCVPDPANGNGYVTTIKFINCNILQNARNVLFNPSVNSTEVTFEGGAIELATGSFPQASFTNMASLRFNNFYTEGNATQPWLELVSVGQFAINGMTNVSGGRITCGDNSTIGNISGYVGQGSNAKLVITGETCKFTILDSQFASSGNTFPAGTRIVNSTINGRIYPFDAKQGNTYSGACANIYPNTGATAVSTGSATDVYRFLDIAGAVVNSYVAGTFYVKATDNATGANFAMYAVPIGSGANFSAAAALGTTVVLKTGGTDPGVSATPFTLVDDGAGGAVKLQFTKNGAISQVNVVVAFHGLY